jgi:ABC-type transport system substrate-binding protein
MADPLIGKNKLLRQALSMAYDPTELIELFYKNRALPAQGPIPPGIPGYDEAFKNPYRQFNLAKAKELLARAGYPGGEGLPPIEYLTVSDTTSRQITEYLTKSFAALEVKLKMNTSSWPEFEASIKNRKGQLWGFAWNGDYPDAENFLQLFYSKNASPGSNDANYSNPEFDRLYEKSLTMEDSPERTKLYRQMAQIVIEDCPWIFHVHRQVSWVTQPWLKNFQYNPIVLNDLKYLKIDQALRK